MSPAHVLEPTYRHIKRAIMDGRWPGGTRLEAMRLADELGVSMTPVRDSLNQLVGEGLVDLTPGEGFRVPAITEQVVRDLLQLNELILLSVLDRDWTDVEQPLGGFDEYADRISAIFAAVARRSQNRALTNVVERVGEQLHTIRRHEPEVLSDAWAVVAELEDSLTASSGHLAGLLRLYHQECHLNVSRLVILVAP